MTPFALSILMVCGLAMAAPESKLTVDPVDKVIWTQCVQPLLDKTPWATNPYDSGHELMLPLHAAFLLNVPEWQKAFADNMQRMCNSDPAWNGKDPLSRFHYLFLASRFLVLANQTGHSDFIPVKLPGYLRTEVERTWRLSDAPNYAGAPFKGGRRERILWIESSPRTPHAYYTIVQDLDFFLASVAADLKSAARLSKLSTDLMLDDVLQVSYRVFKKVLVFTPEGGMVVQPDAWRDHPDMLYAGQSSKRAGMPQRPLDKATWDISHSHRFPLWLTSLVNAFPQSSTQRSFFEEARRRLTHQMMTKVLREPTPDFPAWRTTNYLDGSNGVYRWGYANLGSSLGYGPYELSGTLTLGWWVFLKDASVQSMYRDQLKRIPYSQRVIDIYDSIEMERKGTSPQFSNPSSMPAKSRELCVRLASELPLAMLDLQ